MLHKDQVDMKWISRQIRRRLPGWRIDSLVRQNMNRCIFRVSREGQTGHLHVVRFTPKDRVWASNTQMNWRMRAGSYLSWVQKLCMLQDCDPLALPTECADASSFVRGRARTIFVLQPELHPLDMGRREMYRPMETAQMLYALCQALGRCRDERIPHGELSSQRLMRRKDGGYCLDGMLEPQRLDDFGRPMPSESSEIQQAALLVRDIAMAGRQEMVSNYAADSLQALIDRALAREKGLTLQRVISELEGIIETLQQSVETSEAVFAKTETSFFHDLTELFVEETYEDTIGVKGGHTAQSEDLDSTVGVRKTTGSIPIVGVKTDVVDPDMTVGLRKQMDLSMKVGMQDDPDDEGRTIVTV